MRKASIKIQSVIRSNNRFEGKHYLNTHSFLSLSLENNIEKCKRLEELATVFNPPVFKRQFCKNTPRAVKYFQSSDVQLATEDSNVFLYKGQTEKLNLLVKQNDILVTGFGTIGCTRLVSKYQNDTCYANNVCRIRVKPNIHRGFVYAFMASKYGNAQMNKNASGSVVRYIEAPGIKRTLVPCFPDSFQEEIDGLVRESIHFKECSYDLLEKAKKMIIEYCGVPFQNKSIKYSGKISTSILSKSLNFRFDAPVYINAGVEWIKMVNKEKVLLGDCDIITWYPGMFKRSYVENGYPYIKGSELFLSDPFRRCERLSRTRTPKIDQLWLKENQILISCAGACGLVKLITKEYEEKQAIGSPDIIRLVSEDSLFTKEYLFTYLQLPGIYEFMQSLKYGSVIERFDIENIKTIPIVKPSIELSKEVTEIIQKYSEYTYKAYKSEEKAIRMVEEEIEKWNN